MHIFHFNKFCLNFAKHMTFLVVFPCLINKMYDWMFIHLKISNIIFLYSFKFYKNHALCCDFYH